MSKCIYVNLYCDACCAAPPGKQPLAEGGYPVEIKVNNNNSGVQLNLPKPVLIRFRCTSECPIGLRD